MAGHILRFHSRKLGGEDIKHLLRGDEVEVEVNPPYPAYDDLLVGFDSKIRWHVDLDH